jgi:hypothetical protein
VQIDKISTGRRVRGVHKPQSEDIETLVEGRQERVYLLNCLRVSGMTVQRLHFVNTVMNVSENATYYSSNSVTVCPKALYSGDTRLDDGIRGIMSVLKRSIRGSNDLGACLCCCAQFV